MKLSKIVETIARYIESNTSISIINSKSINGNVSSYQIDASNASIVYHENDFIDVVVNCEISIKSNIEYAEIGSLFVLLKKCEDAKENGIATIKVLSSSERIQILGDGSIRQSLAFTFSIKENHDKILQKIKIC